MNDALTLMLSSDQAETAIQLLDDREAAKLDMLVSEVHGITKSLEAGPLQNDLEAGHVNDILGRAAKAHKELEALRKSRVEPLNREVRNVNALFSTVTGAVDALTDRGKDLLVAWRRQEAARVAREAEETRRRQEEAAEREAAALIAAARAGTDADRDAALAQAEEASLAQTAVALAAPAPAVRGFKSEHATSTAKEVWTFEVVDAALVPRSFCVPDERAIKAAVAGGVRSIPGISIYQEDTITVRSR